MTCRNKYYIDILLDVCRFYLHSMISFQAGAAVIFTAIFCVKMLAWVGVDSRIGDMIFVPCAGYFLWSLLITIVDINIERDVL